MPDITIDGLAAEISEHFGPERMLSFAQRGSAHGSVFRHTSHIVDDLDVDTLYTLLSVNQRNKLLSMAKMAVINSLLARMRKTALQST